jgi:hypothetical protein
MRLLTRTRCSHVPSGKSLGLRSGSPFVTSAPVDLRLVFLARLVICGLSSFAAADVRLEPALGPFFLGFSSNDGGPPMLL